jgi:hypothetical protein
VDPDWGDGVPSRRSLSVDVAGVGGPQNRPGRTALAALVVVAALVGGGVLAGQLFPVDHGAAAASPGNGTTPSASIEATAGAASESPGPLGSSPLIPLTPRIMASPVDVAALVAAIPRHGSGPLVFVAAQLHSTARPCEPGAPPSACLTLRIDGLHGVRVVPDDTMGTWPGDPVPGQTLVLLERNGELVFLGSVTLEPAGIPRIDVLSARLAADPVGYGQPLPSLHEADGILVSGTAPCTASGSSCRADAPALLIVPPSDAQVSDFTDASVVQIAPGALGVDVASARTTGPFLMRRRANPNDGAVSWEVVAREDQGSILHVIVP